MKFLVLIQLVVLFVAVNVRADDSWVAYDRLLAGDGATSDYFGQSVGVSGDFAVIGAYRDDDGGSMSGSAYVFDFNGVSWSQQTKLVADDDETVDTFGESVSISGDYIVAGAKRDDDKGTDSGSVYVFDFNGTSWAQQQKLIAGDGAVGDYFGGSVSIDGNYLVVGADNKDGATGSAYIFYFDGISWSQQTKLVAGDGAAVDVFGSSVSISSDIVIVGASRDDNENGTDSGSAYIFKRDGAIWTQQAKLMADDGAAGDYFARSVSIDGDYAIAGAENSNGTAGSAYIFDFNGVSWSQQAQLVANDATANDFFGWSVSIDGDYAIVGSKAGSDGFSESGFVYVFKRNGIAWTQTAKLACPDVATNDSFAKAVCIDDNRIISGAYGASDYTGSAYIFELQLPCPSADLTGDCFVDMNDFAIFTGQWMTGN